MASPSYITSYQDGHDSGGSSSIDVLNVVDGDWILVGIGSIYENGTLTVGGTGAGIYEAIGSQIGDTAVFANFIMQTWRKIATGSGTYTVTSDAPNETVLEVIHLRDCGDIDGTPYQGQIVQNQSNLSVIAGPVSPQTDDAMLIGFFGLAHFSSVKTWTSAAMTERADKSNPSAYCTMQACTELLTASGSTGTRTSTASGSGTVYGEASKLFAISGVATVSPPIVDAGVDTDINVGSTFTRTATETGGIATSQQWSIQSGPSNPVLSSGDTVSVFLDVAGTYVFRYTASNAGGSDFDEATVTVNSGNETIVTVTEDFEDTTYAIPFTGTWTRNTTQVHSGTYSLKAAAIPDNGSTEVVFTLPEGCLDIQFWWKVSSENSYDFFAFSLGDDPEVFARSGNQGWLQSTVYDTTGYSTVKFRYYKDVSATGGSDTAWVDDIVLHVASSNIVNPEPGRFFLS